MPAKVELALQHFRSLGLVQNRDPGDNSSVSLHALIREGALSLLDRSHLRDRDQLIREAAEWYWRNGSGPAAVRLALQAGPMLMDVARDWLISLSFNLVFRSGLHHTLVDLVELWEKSSGQTDPRIDEAAGWALTFQRQFSAALERIDRLEVSVDQELRSVALLQKAGLVALRDDFAESGALSHQWIKQHQGTHSFHMGVASAVHAFSLKCIGESEAAQSALREAIHCFDAAQSTYGTGWSHFIGALIQVQAGRYRSALAQEESGLTRCPSEQGFGSLRSMLRAVEAFVRYERDELDSVREILSEVLGLLPDQGNVDAIGLGYTAAARTRAASGDFGSALDILSDGEQVGMQREYPRLTFILRAERALLLQRSGSTTQARLVVNSIPNHWAMRTSRCCVLASCSRKAILRLRSTFWVPCRAARARRTGRTACARS